MRVKKHHHTPMGIFKLPRLFRWRQMATKRCLDHIWRVNRNSLWIMWNQKWTFGEEGEVDIWRRKFWRKFANFWTNVGGRSPSFGASRIPAPRVHSSCTEGAYVLTASRLKACAKPLGPNLVQLTFVKIWQKKWWELKKCSDVKKSRFGTLDFHNPCPVKLKKESKMDPKS